MTLLPALLLQDTGGSGAALIGLPELLVILAISVVFIVGMWRVFTRAGQPGWVCIIPIYNLYVLLQIAADLAGGSCSCSFRWSIS